MLISTNINTDTITSCLPFVAENIQVQGKINQEATITMSDATVEADSSMTLNKENIQSDKQRDILFNKETEPAGYDNLLNKENIQSDNQIVKVKLIDLSPLPKITEEKKKRSRASLKSEIVTGTPYKNQLAEKRKEEENKARKRIKPIDLDFQPGPSGINRDSLKKKKNSNSMKTCGQITTNKEPIYCPICEEKYEDPPAEDWIQ